MKKLFLFLLIGIVFTSCQQHTLSASLSSASPDTKTIISVNAKKQASLDPYTVTLEVKAGAESLGSLQFEITASAIDSSDVRFDWKDANNCTITFTQSDNEKRVFAYYATTSNVVLQEIKKD